MDIDVLFDVLLFNGLKIEMRIFISLVHVCPFYSF